MYSVWIACMFGISVSSVCSSENTTESDLLSNTTESDLLNNITESDLPSNITSQWTLPAYLVGKDESLLSCLAFELTPEEYELLSNGFAHIHLFNITLNESFYILKNETLSFCQDQIASLPDDPVEIPITLAAYLSVIGISISMISLFLHLVVFSLVPVLRNQPGWNLATLCASLFMSYLLFLVKGTDSISKYRNACVATASLTHFFLLASFLWMTIMSCDISASLLRATGSFRKSSNQFSQRKFGVYCLSAFGISFLFALSSILVDVLDILPQQYRPDFHESCWFSHRIPLLVFFVGPVIALTCINFLLFGLSAYIIHSNKRKTDQDAQNSILQKRYLMYFRLSVIMGVTWIVGIVANAINEDWVWCVFVILNTLQGFFIFLAFTCSEKVKKYFRQKFTEVTGSSQTLTSTFQSYCSFDVSSEKNLDKIAESSKEKSDSTTIHL